MSENRRVVVGTAFAFLLLLASALSHLQAQPPPSATTGATVKAASNAPKDSAFSGAVSGLSIMQQVIDNLERKVNRQSLSSLHIEDIVFKESLSMILQQASHFELSQRKPFQDEVKALAKRVADLHLAGDLNQQSQAETKLQDVLATFDKIKAFFPDKIQLAAKTAASQYMCPAHRDVRGKKSDLCPKCGQLMDQQVRLLPPFCGLVAPAKRTVHARIHTDKPVVPGQAVNAFVQLNRADKTPVYPSDLMVAHTERIHLLIIDSSLTDYHHEHPQPTKVPGEYAFSFRPSKPGNYLAWVELRTEPLGLQEYVTTTIETDTKAEPLSDRSVSHRAEQAGLVFDLKFDRDRLAARRPILGRLSIAHKNGDPVKNLEPIMDAFVHLVGFNEDRRTVLHIHPKGAAVTDPNARGGPDIEFLVYTSRPGFVRLFAQVKIDRKVLFIPFGVYIQRR